jgi:hypothetical protein
MTHFRHVDQDGDVLEVVESIRGTDNVLVSVTHRFTGKQNIARVSGPDLRDALVEAFPLPVAEDAEFDAWTELPDSVGEDRPEFQVGDRVQYRGWQYSEPRNQEGAGTIKYVYDSGAFGVEQDDGGRVFSYFDHQLEHITDVDALGEILRSAEEYAAPRAAHAYATAFSAFVASLYPVEG